MLGKALFFLILFGIGFSIIFLVLDINSSLESYLNKSVPYIGADIPHQNGYTGEGIIIAVIDTGVDYNHPDLFGFGNKGKVVDGFNFVKEEFPPIDTNGHGTQVAGIISGDGEISGVAPKSKILAYKVSEDGEHVSSDLIVKAINQAIEDKVDIINISLGVNKTNSRIDESVNQAIDQGIIVVTAAGNDGPNLESIGSPGMNSEAITVGATYNNITSSLVATLEVKEEQFQVIPMIGSASTETPITAPIEFGSFGREYDLEKGVYSDKILLVERGSDKEEEIVYFSDKEKNASNVGAMALVVYNNKPGMFLGELTHEFVEATYKPEIPVVSMTREDGLKLKSMIESSTNGTLNVFYNADFVAPFSSRGPVSPFYIKPEIVAPGAFINTTTINGAYNFTGGTSFAAPHVSGAIALLLQQNPNLDQKEVKSIILTTSDPVSNPYGDNFSFNDAGWGRLNITRALEADLILSPPSLIFDLSSENPKNSRAITILPVDGTIGDLDINFVGPNFIKLNAEQNGNKVSVSVENISDMEGSFEGFMTIRRGDMVYRIPILIHSTHGELEAFFEGNNLRFEISSPQDWTFAKISIFDSKIREYQTVSITPNKDTSVPLKEAGHYWIEAKIRTDGKSLDAFEFINVESVEDQYLFDPLNSMLPLRQVIIISAIVAVIIVVGIKLR